MIAKFVLLLAIICTFINAVSVKCPYMDALKAQAAKGDEKSTDMWFAQNKKDKSKSAVKKSISEKEKAMMSEKFGKAAAKKPAILMK